MEFPTIGQDLEKLRVVVLEKISNALYTVWDSENFARWQFEKFFGKVLFHKHLNQLLYGLGKILTTGWDLEKFGVFHVGSLTTPSASHAGDTDSNSTERSKNFYVLSSSTISIVAAQKNSNGHR